MDGNEKPTAGDKQTPPPIEFDLVGYVKQEADPAALAAAFHQSFKKDYTSVSGQERFTPYVTLEEIDKANNREKPLLTNTLQHKYAELSGLSQFPQYRGLFRMHQYSTSLDPLGSVSLEDANRFKTLADPTLRKEFIQGDFAKFKADHVFTRTAEGFVTGFGGALVTRVGLSIAARRLNPTAAGYARIAGSLTPFAGISIGAGSGYILGNMEANSYLNRSVEKADSILDYIKNENR